MTRCLHQLLLYQDLCTRHDPPCRLNFTPWWSILKLGKDVVEEVQPGMNWKKLLESISESVNDHLRLRNDYLVAENRLLRNQIDGRVRLTDNERQELAEIGVQLGKQALAEIATVATPDTILAWHRTFVDQKVDPPSRVNLLAVPASTRRLKTSWCVWPERIARGAMIASRGP